MPKGSVAAGERFLFCWLFSKISRAADDGDNQLSAKIISMVS
ncbi:hypothetical protein [uncultured Neglectibacter sp.]